MNFTRVISPVLLGGVLFGLVACSVSRPLITRGLSKEERRHFVIQNGYGIAPDIKNSFIEGFPKAGMTQELVFQLYGSPDRTMEGNKIWEYVDKNGQLVTGFKFKDKIVEEIMGDPRGGLPVEQEAP